MRLGKFLLLTLVTSSITISYSGHAYLVWSIVDPAKIQQKITQIVKDGVRSAEKIAKGKAKSLADFKKSLEELTTANGNKAAQLKSVTESISETTNRQLQETYMPHPDVCEFISTIGSLGDVSDEICDSPSDDPFDTGESSLNITVADTPEDFAKKNKERTLSSTEVQWGAERIDSFLDSAAASTRSELPGNNYQQAIKKSVDLIEQAYGQKDLGELTGSESKMLDAIFSITLDKKNTDILFNPNSYESIAYADKQLSKEYIQQVAAALIKSTYRDRTVNNNGLSKMSVVIQNGTIEEFERRLKVISEAENSEPTGVNPDDTPDKFLEPSAVVSRESAMTTLNEINTLYHLLEKSLNKEFAAAIRTQQLEELNSGS